MELTKYIEKSSLFCSPEDLSPHSRFNDVSIQGARESKGQK